MRRALLTAIFLIALPLTATADYCAETNLISQLPKGPRMGDLGAVGNPPVLVEVVGSFLWVQINNGEIVSYEIPATADGFTACESGSVTFSHPEVNVEVEIEPVVEPVCDCDQAEYTRFVETDSRYGPR